VLLLAVSHARLSVLHNLIEVHNNTLHRFKGVQQMVTVRRLTSPSGSMGGSGEVGKNGKLIAQRPRALPTVVLTPTIYAPSTGTHCQPEHSEKVLAQSTGTRHAG
jgi:hypothetical protein